MVKAHFEPNPVTLESALYSMLEGFYNTGKEHICQYILDNYIYDEDCGADLSDVIRQRAQGIINLQVGKTPPNFTMDKWDGGSLNLMETAKANKYTLVMFWASWCHKCEQEIPVLIPVHAKYKSQGFEAIGVSLDQARSTWVGVIEQRGMSYPNVSQLQGWDSPIVKDYKITATFGGTDVLLAGQRRQDCAEAQAGVRGRRLLGEEPLRQGPHDPNDLLEGQVSFWPPCLFRCFSTLCASAFHAL